VDYVKVVLRVGKNPFVLVLIIIAIGLFSGPEAQIEWSVYFGMLLAIIFGASVAVAFITRRVEAILFGVMMVAMLPVLFQSC